MAENSDYELKETAQGLQIERKVRRRVLDYSAYFLTYDEAKRLKEAALTFGDSGSRYYLIVCLGLDTGLRRSEIRKLKIEQIDMNENMLKLGTDTKTRTPRRVPFNDELRKHLLLAIGNRTSGFLLMHPTARYSEKAYSDVQINNIIAKIGRKAGIAPKGEGLKNLNPHLLRHSWAKFCQKAGIPKEHVRVMGGWKSMKMLDLIYGVPDYQSISQEYRVKMNW